MAARCMRLFAAIDFSSVSFFFVFFFFLFRHRRSFRAISGRPQRYRVKPLEYWKGERAIYKQQIKNKQKTGLFVIKDVLLIETPEDVRKVRRRVASQRRGKTFSCLLLACLNLSQTISQ